MPTYSTKLSQLAPPASDGNAETLEIIEEMTRNPKLVQEKLLADILSKNAETEYLQRFGLDGATDSKTFKSRVPVVTYEDIQPDIERIANGDRSAILTADPVMEFFTSSGTSHGICKLIPVTKESWGHRTTIDKLVKSVMNCHFPGLNEGKSLNFVCVFHEAKTPGGLITQPVLTKYYKSAEFKNQRSDPYTTFTSPTETIIYSDWNQSMYVQILCGLYERKKVNRLTATFASGFIRVIRLFQAKWQEIARDIRTGKLDPNIINPSIRACMTRIVKPDPDLSGFVTRECSNENWGGIIRRIWPNAKCIEVVITGSMAQYIPMLDYYGGGLPLVSRMYGSSESNFGLNLSPLCKPTEISYTILPNMAYFEFIPRETPSGCDSPVDLTDVEIGKEYEVAVTTNAGLYRYRMGDILRVTGFHNCTPQFKFVGRKNAFLSIDADKTDEAELQTAVKNASKLLQPFKTFVADFACYAEPQSNPGHYVVYWELSADDSISGDVLTRCCLVMEDSLNMLYRQLRAGYNVIGPLEIRVVKSGTFELLMDQAIARGVSSQYKVPRCVTSKEIIELLDSRVVSSYFSPSLPYQTI